MAIKEIIESSSPSSALTRRYSYELFLPCFHSSWLQPNETGSGDGKITITSGKDNSGEKWICFRLLDI